MDFQITRDGHGVPHVQGETAADAWAGMGYACAQDRLFQLDYDRRRACGRWAEIAGVGAVGADVLARRLGLAAAAQRDVAVMSAPVRAAFEAYAGGVNAAIADGALPLPGRYPVEPWQAWHSVAAYLVRHVLMGQWQHKLANAVLLARVGPAAFARLETRPPLGSPIAVPPGGRLEAPVSRLLDDALGDVVGHLGFLAEVEPGSNAWAVSGRRTAHGGAVICNDSHRALDTPNVYWQCRVSCPSFDVVGATFPGLPGYPHFGFNGSVGWAITHADGDTQDLYLERFSGARYLTEDGWAAADARQERINVRGGSPVTVSAWSTRHGPVVHGSPGSGIALALKWTGIYRANRGFECLPAMLTARSVTELCDAQDGWVDPVNNLVCADASGRIAYQCRGEVPTRSSDGARRLPVVGWDGACEWNGTVPFAELPRAVDPDAGFVITANNAIVDGDSPYLSYTFAQPFRAERLRSLLADSAPVTVDSLAGMQADTVSLAARGWGRLLGSLGPFGSDRRRGGAVAAGRLRRGPRGRVGRRDALRLLRPGTRGGAVPAGARHGYLGLGRVGHARADDVHGPAVARQRHLGAARDAGSVRWRSGQRRSGRRRSDAMAASGGGGCWRRSRARWPRRGRRRSTRAARTPRNGAGAMSTGPYGCTRTARPGWPTCRWAATPTPSRPPGTAGGRALRSTSPCCPCTGRWWTSRRPTPRAT